MGWEWKVDTMWEEQVLGGVRGVGGVELGGVSGRGGVRSGGNVADWVLLTLVHLATAIIGIE